ncbi:MaoC family dehydratase N-terminal domain-containing protein (plasmid) [Cupriavidus pinatubonensis]|uniref:FAS1-like dehydratase domain-containing protein n=1 Tax=Cupriavidus pinatubonensis TaxID=248026 RepID=UPI001C73408E|nr:MaoC family dehydratase N-terminal domain-containing protein [Cupriavidus pinatubonensis]QYY33830.1 MaoC family dehydratase N-terminal domain-containing protein [Cupriavidus pinatubonensis]
MTPAQNDVGNAPAEGRITDEAIADAKAMIGLHLRPEGPYLQDATADTLRNWCNGIGDLNPLYRDVGYASGTRYGTQLGHPMFPMAFGWLGRTRWGLPGVHGFYAGNDWELFRHVRPGDRITAIERVVGVEEKHSQFSGRLVLQYVEASYFNQRGELVARALGTCTRHERKAARDTGKYKEIVQHEYSNEEFDRIDEMVLNEPKNIRGSNVRYWEEVQVGEELPTIARGPLSLMDTMGFLVGCGRGHTHGVVLQAAVKHPGHFFRNPEAGGGVEYTGIGHHRESVAKEVGVPGTYDYGPQRSSWMASLVTNWMGDAGVLKRVRTEMRRFNIVGDTTFCKGKVVRKYVKDNVGLVDIELAAENQRGEVTTPGIATVALPSRDVKLKAFLDGSAVDLELPITR